MIHYSNSKFSNFELSLIINLLFYILITLLNFEIDENFWSLWLENVLNCKKSKNTGIKV